MKIKRFIQIQIIGHIKLGLRPYTQEDWAITQDEDILIGDDNIVPGDGEEPLGPDKIGFYTFFLEGLDNPPNLMGVDDDQSLAIQNDL